MMEITNDLNNFGYIELSEAAELLEAYANAKQRQKLDFLGPEPKNTLTRIMPKYLSKTQTAIL